VTLALTLLSRLGALDADRPDDRARYGPAEPILRRTGDNFQIVGPQMLRRSFPVKKGAGTCRVFVTGESFAQGQPYVLPHTQREAGGDLVNWLRAELETRFPSRRFEVINAAAPAINSTGVRAIAVELIAAEPDLLVVLTGNNEGAVAETRFNEALHQWIVYRVLKRGLLRESVPAERPYFTPQNPERDKIAAQFRENLTAIAAASRQAGVPLAVATLPIHLRYEAPPAAQDEPPDDALAAGDRLRAAGRCREAAQAYGRSRQQARALLGLARCAEATGDFAQAKQLYRSAIELHPQNRIRPSFNEIIREVARSSGATLIDLEQALENSSPQGLPDPALFLDNCHLTWSGYYLMALEIARVLSERRLVAGDSDEPRPPLPIEEIIMKYGWDNLREAKPPSLEER
jgi:lysophospholipase L1-like esterase